MNKDGQKNGNRLRNVMLLSIMGIFLASLLIEIISYFNVIEVYKPILYAITIVSIGILSIEIISRGIKRYIEYKGISKEASKVADLFRVIAYAILVIVVLGALNINVTGLLLSAGFLGIVIGLAAQTTLGNVFSGLSLIIAKPFRPSDFITIHAWQTNIQPPSYLHQEFVPGYSGVVASIGLMYTRLIDGNGTPIYIPNSTVNGALIINHHRAKARVIKISFDVMISIPIDAIEGEIKKIMKSEGIENNDWSVNIETLNSTIYVITLEVRVLTGKELSMKGKIFRAIVEKVQELEKKK